MSPDPCDAREGEPGPGFTLPCRCGAAVKLESVVAQLAQAKGTRLDAERVTQGLTLHPRQTTQLPTP